MSFIPNPQRVPFGTVNRDGTVTIAKEWIRFFDGLSTSSTTTVVTSTGTSTSGTVDLSGINAEITALQAEDTSLQAQISALTICTPDAVLYDETGLALFDSLGYVLTDGSC